MSHSNGQGVTRSLQRVKHTLRYSPTMISLVKGLPLMLYLTSTNKFIGALLVKEVEWPSFIWADLFKSQDELSSIEHPCTHLRHAEIMTLFLVFSAAATVSATLEATRSETSRMLKDSNSCIPLKISFRISSFTGSQLNMNSSKMSPSFMKKWSKKSLCCWGVLGISSKIGCLLQLKGVSIEGRHALIMKRHRTGLSTRACSSSLEESRHGLRNWTYCSIPWGKAYYQAISSFFDSRAARLTRSP